MDQLGVLLLPPGWDVSPSQGYPQQYVVGTHLYTWVQRDNVEQSFCLRKQHSNGVEPTALRSSDYWIESPTR